MANGIANPDFFKRDNADKGKKEAQKSLLPDKEIKVSLSISPKLLNAIDEAADTLNNADLSSFANEITGIANEASRQRFTVAVVGEFSRGKSTFINKMFAKELLPVANMPTTAMLTRIRYDEKEGITIIDTGSKRKRELPLSVDSWEEYIADDDGNDPNGVAFVGINSPWLKNGIEIIDTPGAGDLEAKRAAIIGDALKGSDSAIITISATSAMSMSEKLFIEERLISKKTPFLMLIITKLDQIEKAQRNSVIDFVREKLKMWKMNNIPVYVPYKVDMPDNKYDAIIGMDKVVKQINSWILSSDRKKLTQRWLALKVRANLDAAANFVKEQKCLTDAENSQKKQQLINQKKEMLSNAERTWDDIKLSMMEKCNQCYDLFYAKATEHSDVITEKLQYEMMHTGNLKKWWEEDYPYRLKIEMTSMSAIMENVVSRQVAKDVAWFNSVLEKNFKTNVLYSPDEIADKASYTQFNVESNVKIKDMSTERNVSRIGITALSITAALMFASVGVASIIGTMGVGTGGSIISESIFKKKSESQREVLKAELGKSVPKVVHDAMAHSESRIKRIYTDIINESTKQQESWFNNQKSVINSAASKVSEKDTKALDETLKTIDAIRKEISKHI